MLAFLVAALLAQGSEGPTYRGQPREPHALAPSLPKLTDKETQEIEDIIDRFIDADTGKLKGAAATKAQADFKALGPAATFLLIDGLNRAANMEDSCPAVLIGKKLSLILNGSRDRQLLDFARENIGAGVTAKRHVIVLKDLKLACTLRIGALQRADIAAGKTMPSISPAKKNDVAAKKLSTSELIAAVDKLKGDDLKPILVELSKRKGEPVIETLGIVAGKDDKATQSLAKTLLVEVLVQDTPGDLKARLKNPDKEIRVAAATAISAKSYRLTEALIEALDDAEEVVRQAARQALVTLADRQADHGPERGASPSERVFAQQAWRTFWDKQN